MSSCFACAIWVNEPCLEGKSSKATLEPMPAFGSDTTRIHAGDTQIQLQQIKQQMALTIRNDASTSGSNGHGAPDPVSAPPLEPASSNALLPADAAVLERQRHRLLPDIDLGEIRGRSLLDDDDTDWDDCFVLIPVGVVLVGLIVIAFLLWPIISYDGTVFASVNGGQSLLLSIATADFALLSVSAGFLPSQRLNNSTSDVSLNTPHSTEQPSDNLNHAQKLLLLRRQSLSDNTTFSADKGQVYAHAHFFYNAPPATIRSSSPILRTLNNVTLGDYPGMHTLSVLKFGIIEGGNVSVEWRFTGGAPDFHVFRSEEAFDTWRSDSIPPASGVVHTEYSKAHGSYRMTGQPTDEYFFVFAAPVYFWPRFNATGTLRYKLDLMEYDLSGSNDERPAPIASCSFGMAELTSAISNNITTTRGRTKGFLNAVSMLFGAMTDVFFYSPSNATEETVDVTRNGTFGLAQNVALFCQIPPPNPKFVPIVHVLLVSPPARPDTFGGPGNAGAVTSDPRAVGFIVSPTPKTRASPVLFFVWAFCAVIGLSVGVAAAVGGTVWAVAVAVRWVRVAMGLETPGGARLGGVDGVDDEEALPLYVGDAGDGDVGLMFPPPPPYSVEDLTSVSARASDREQDEASDETSVEFVDVQTGVSQNAEQDI
ncbi:hypothetical protein HDU83_004055 [Entophlyctis luteolus]|nr:hypothetical protein HDU83_004055 [Entophlyctis luteolus]